MAPVNGRIADGESPIISNDGEEKGRGRTGDSCEGKMSGEVPPKHANGSNPIVQA